MNQNRMIVGILTVALGLGGFVTGMLGAAATAPVPPPAPTKAGGFTLTLNAAPGNGGRVIGAGVFPGNSAPTVTAVVGNGFVFAGWFESGKMVSSAPAYTITLSGNRMLTAMFTPAPAAAKPAPLPIPTRGGTPPVANPVKPVAIQPTTNRPGPPGTRSMQPPAHLPPDAGQPPPPPPRREVRVVVDRSENPHRFMSGPQGEAFAYVHEPPEDRLIASREHFLDRLLRPNVNALVWGLGDIGSIEVAEYLGLPLSTPLYAIEPGVPVYPAMLPGYFVAGEIPPGVALVSGGPQGPMILFQRVPPGTVVAYQPSPFGEVLNECLVAPPVPVAGPVPEVVVVPSPDVGQTPTTQPAPTTRATAKVVFDANGQAVGAIIFLPDGRQEFVPVR